MRYTDKNLVSTYVKTSSSQSGHLLYPGLFVVHISVKLVQSVGLVQLLMTICGHVFYSEQKKYINR